MNPLERLMCEDCLRRAERDYPKSMEWIKAQLDKGADFFDIKALLYVYADSESLFLLVSALKVLA